MIEIDGSDGGGQLLRSAVGIAARRGEAVRVENVRGNRPDPGLKHQHLAAVEAVAKCCDATVEGAVLGSDTVTFDPGPVAGGEVSVAIPTAGSVTLVFDAVALLAPALPAPLTVTATGGTDVAWSPPSSYYRRVRTPLLARAGTAAAVEIDRHGFYPAGNGRARLHVAPSAPAPLALHRRGAAVGARVCSLCSEDLADANVAARQADAAVERLRDAGLDVVERTESVVSAGSTGSAVLVRLDYERSVAGFDALGEPGRSAETVGDRAAEAAVDFHEGGGAVDPHAADQLLPTLAVAGGRVLVPEVTEHVETHLALLETFECEIEREDRTDGVLLSAPGTGGPAD